MSWIVMYHYLHMEGETLLSRFIGDRPLDLFTVISGFVTHLAYAKRKELNGPCTFFLRRCSKLACMYYLSLFLAFFVKLVWLGHLTEVPPISAVW
jgi:peptidoglycan/LPS O-acetylase OafA/YrhL